PTDGLWHGAMHAIQDPTVLGLFGGAAAGSPFVSEAPLAATYLAWTALWVLVALSLATMAFKRRDL
ncbi:MAG TPA: hypothetical protein VNP92_11435, partial [Actinophytocola sp.]|nr:hypothetical protein [Actinophytocola sp.]